MNWMSSDVNYVINTDIPVFNTESWAKVALLPILQTTYLPLQYSVYLQTFNIYIIGAFPLILWDNLCRNVHPYLEKRSKVKDNIDAHYP